MYGLLLEAIGDIIKRKYGEQQWAEISMQAGVSNLSFAHNEVYEESLIPRISEAAAYVLQVDADEIMFEFGMGFVDFVGQYDYDKILRVLGRHMRDFLNGLDNLHDHLRFSYHSMRAPSFFVEKETKRGLTLHYRTRRKGFVHYVRGQLRKVGEVFYKTDVDITVVSQKESNDGAQHVVFQLDFDNSAFMQFADHTEDSIVDAISLKAEILFELFPFHLVFGPNMVIRSVGSAMNAVLPNTVGQQLTDVFLQTRPIIDFCWEEILAHTNNVFELVTRNELSKPNENGKRTSASCASTSCIMDDQTNLLHLKGQMVFMEEWNSIMFLGTPIMQNLEDMFKAGLYINDLSMHDCSRDLVLAGTQQSAELKLALAQEQQKSQLLTASMKKLDEEIRTTDEFVYQMIPKPVADRLRQGDSAVNTCQSFDCVTILFSDVVGFTTICSRITPMEVVSMLNAMYTAFDHLSENHCVYKVETIGDAYMAVAGAPTVTADHAESMCDMALDMLAAMPHLKDPSSNDSMRIRIGVHTGSTVAGVVGLKMPRYCLFGDTVNTASRMESTGEAMKIHISETTKQKLVDTPYILKERGTVHIKGKGSMKTYWMMGRQGKSVREKKVKDSQKKSQLLREGKDAATLSATPGSEQDHLAVNAAATHRHIYSPVSFDDLATTGGGPDHGGPRHSLGSSPRTSLSHAAGEPRRTSTSSSSSSFLPWRKDSSGKIPERKVSGLCPLSRMSGSSRVPRVDNPVSGVPGISVSDGGKESGEGSVGPQPLPSETNGDGDRQERAPKSAGGTVVSNPLTSSASTTTPSSPVTDSMVHKPTQTVLPTLSDSPPVAASAAGRTPDGVTLHGSNPHDDPNHDPVHHNHLPPQGTRPLPHPHNNNSDKTRPIQARPPSEDGPSSVHSPQGVATEKAANSQPVVESGQRVAKSVRNGKVKGSKNKAERPLSSLGRQKSPHPYKSRSKACVIL